MQPPRIFTFGVRSLLARLWLILALILLTVFGQIPGHSKFAATLQDGCHAPVFFVLTLLLLGILARRKGSSLLALVIAVFIGISIELVQKMLGGDASAYDVSSDSAGAFAALAAHSVAKNGRGKTIAPWVIATAAAYWVAPLVWCVCAYANRSLAFPAISRFETPLDLYFFKDDLAKGEIEPMPGKWSAGPGDLALLLTLPRSPWPGLELAEPAEDWSGHQWLNMELTNPNDEPLRLTLRINDRQHHFKFEDRFNRAVLVGPNTRTTLRILVADVQRAPAGREMDLRHVSSLILFGDAKLAGRSFFLNRIWLE